MTQVHWQFKHFCRARIHACREHSQLLQIVQTELLSVVHCLLFLKNTRSKCTLWNSGKSKSCLRVGKFSKLATIFFDSPFQVSRDWVGICWSWCVFPVICHFNDKQKERGGFTVILHTVWLGCDMQYHS